MKNALITRALLTLSLALPAAALTACGDSSDGDTTSGTATGTGTTTASGSAAETSSTPATTTGTNTASGTESKTDTSSTTDNSSTDTNSTGTAPTKNLVELAKDSADFKTLAQLIELAELGTVLGGTEEFTVFGPTDAAFAAADQAALTTLKGDKEALKKALLHHVIAGKVAKADLSGTVKKTSKNGTDLVIEASTTGVTVDGAKVLKPDLMATNGIIHGVDKVIFTPAKKISELVTADTKLSKLLKALGDAELVDTFAGQGPFTLFAPTDAAFDKFTTAGGTIPTDKAKLATFLKKHAATGATFSFELTNNQEIATLDTDTKQKVVIANGEVKVGEGKVTGADIRASNGIIHVVDTVLVPVTTN